MKRVVDPDALCYGEPSSHQCSHITLRGLYHCFKVLIRESMLIKIVLLYNDNARTLIVLIRNLQTFYILQRVLFVNLLRVY